MAETLFITPAEMAATTILGGNVDPEKYVVNIAMAQISVIEPLLGSELYDKIKADFEGDTLSGKYETLFNEYVKPILKHEALAEYIEVSNFMVNNGGTFRHSAENTEPTSKDDTQFLSGKYHNMAQLFVKRFNKWICKNNVPEYKRYQDEVNAQKIQVKAGWYFGRSSESANEINECDL